MKTALIAGGELWRSVRGGADPTSPEVIVACAHTKLRIVAQDERDTGLRQVLNLGHTVAHAIEAVTGYARYRHGEAVALGLLATLRLSEQGALAVIYSAIGSLLLAYAGWSYVVTRLGAARAGVTLHLMPAFGVVLSAIFLSEYPQWFHFAGIALILVGVALSSLRPTGSSSREERPSP